MDTLSHIESAKAQRFYADTAGLSGLKLDKDNPESLKAVAKEFEALFIKMMLKSMREANQSLKSEYFGSSDEAFYQEMYDNQIAMHLSGSERFGLSQAIVQQMRPHSEDLIAENEISIKTIEGNESTEKNNTRQQTLDKPEAFIQLVWPHVVRGAQKLGVDPKVLVAQAALETGWGTSITKNEQGKPSYNLFNIKADRRWQGKTTETMTTEYENNKAVRKKENFRSYLNIAESVDDYVSFIKENPRYHQALKQASNPQAYMEAIHQAGYATDPKYHQKVMSIYEGARLNNGVDWLKQRSLSLKI